MKGISTKKVFTIIGIVVGSVSAFVGAVFGVLALAGKFKTPIVYPVSLSFEFSEQTIIQGNPFDASKIDQWEAQFEDENKAPKIEYFKLVGFDPKSKYEVNKKDCYLWFEKDEDSKLITLCEENGKPLVPNEYNRYLVQCNEPIYYMVNKIDDDTKINQIDGEVVLYARSTKDSLTKPSNPLKIYIDREVQSVFVKDRDWDNQFFVNSYSTALGNNQSISLAVNDSFDFEFAITTPLSIKPITNVSAKEIEIYYDVAGRNYGTDYVRVTPEEVANSNSPLNQILTYNTHTKTYTFKGSKADVHEFKLAVFPTYQAKAEYLARIDGETGITNFERIGNMLITTFYVTVDNVEISEITLSTSAMNMGLYSKNYISLDSENRDVISLGLQMYKGSLIDNSRFNEAEFKQSFSSADLVNENIKTPKFSNGSTTIEFAGVLTINGGYKFEYNGMEFTVVTSNTKLVDDLTIIDHVEDVSTNKYYCISGIPILDETGTDKKIRLLKSGVYLTFYKDNDPTVDVAYSVADSDDFEFSVVAQPESDSKTWELVTKSIPEDVKLGVLCANSKGEFVCNRLLKMADVIVNENQLVYTTKTSNETLKVEFDGTDLVADSKPFTDFIEYNSGSYSALVFVVEDSNSVIDTSVGILVTYGSQPYKVVGYTDESGNFVNAVRFTENLTKDNKEVKLHLAQLKNAYEEDVQTTLNKATVEIADLKLNAVTVVGEYVFNPDLIDSVVDSYDVDDYYYEGKDVAITIQDNSNAQMVNKLVEYYQINTGSGHFKLYDDNNNLITSVTDIFSNFDADENKLTIKIPNYSVFDILNVKKLVIKLEIGDKSKELLSFKVKTKSPENIYLYNNGSESVKLYDVDEYESKNSYIKAEISYESNGYVNEFDIVKDGTETGLKLTSSELFNVQDPENPTTAGFTGFTGNNGQGLDVDYSSGNSEILSISKDGTSWEVCGVKDGNTYLKVKIGNTIKYIKVEVDTTGFAIEEINKNKIWDNSTGSTEPLDNLNKLIKFSYNPNTIDIKTNNNINVTDVVVQNYGAGILTRDESADGFVFKSSGDAEVFKIYEDNSTNEWKIQYNTSHTSLSIQIKVETCIGETVLSVNFKSARNFELSEDWKDGILYADTEVQFVKVGSVENSVISGFDTSLKAVFNYGTGSSTVYDTGSNITNGYITIPEEAIGKDVTLEIKQGDNLIAPFEFVVKPNVFAELKTSLDLKTSGGTKLITDIYTLTQYPQQKGGSPYGSSANSHYNDVAKGNLIDISKLTIEVEAETAVTGGTDLTIKGTNTLQEIKEYSTKISLKYETADTGDNDYLLSSDDEIVIKHEYLEKITLTDVDGKTGEDAKNFKYIALTDYTCPVQLDVSEFNLDSIYADDLEFDISSGMKLNTSILNTLDGVELKFTFKNSGSTETYYYVLKNVEFIPYRPIPINTKIVVGDESGKKEVLLFNELYGEGTLNSSGLIKKLEVLGLYSDEDGENEITSVISSGELPLWTSITGGASVIKIYFNNISTAEKDVYIKYKITYDEAGTKTYIYFEKITLKNNKTIVIQYPENKTISSQAFIAIEDRYEEMKSVFKEKITQNQNNAIHLTLTDFNYETVLISTKTNSILNFKYDDFKKITRAKTDEDIEISLVAYDIDSDFSNAFYDQLKSATNSIEFGTANVGESGYIILELKSTSGYCAYYVVYCYCMDVETTVGKQIEVLSKSNGTNSLSVEGMIEFGNTNRDETRTYKDLLESLDTDNKFERTFGIKYSQNKNLITAYLYSLTSPETEETTTNYWKQIDLTDPNLGKIAVDSKFNTIIIGLIYESSTTKYCLGRVVIYSQPTIGISASNLKFEEPNGYFTGDISTGADNYDCPFGTGWNSAEITGIVSSDGSYDFDEDDGKIKKGSNVVIEVDDTKLKIEERVTTDLVFKVKYTKDDTVAIVTYTYKSSDIPDQDKINKISIEGFNETGGFVNSINITSEENKAKFFDVYEGEYNITFSNTITGDPTGVTDLNTSASKVLTFKLTEVNRTVEMEITYVNYPGQPTRTFTFDIQAGVFVEDNGFGESSPLVTKRKDYTSTTGSQLVVTMTQDTNSTPKWYKYTIQKEGEDGIDIYTATQGYLRISETGDSYLTSSKAGNYVTIAHDQDNSDVTLDFAHLAKEQNIKLNIDICSNNFEVKTLAVGTSSGGYFNEQGSEKTPLGDDQIANSGTTYYLPKKYVEKIDALHIKAIQTYKDFTIKYLVDNAKHENVCEDSVVGATKSGANITCDDSINLNKTFIDKFTIKDMDGNAIDKNGRTAMGFATIGNLNYFEFKTDGKRAMSLQESGAYYYLQFNSVDSNTICTLSASNKAGIKDVEYKYQVMDGTQVDGLDFSSSSGFRGADYLSFMMDGIKTNEAYSEMFVIGTMKDTANKNAFNVAISVPSGVAVSGPIVYNEWKYNNGSEDFVIPVANRKGHLKYENGIQYTATINDYTYYITLDTNTKKVELIVEKDAGTDPANIKLEISLAGVNGDLDATPSVGTILNKYEIYLSKDSVKVKDSFSIEDYYGGTSNINITDVIDGPDATYTLKEVVFTCKGNTYTFTEAEDWNSILTYDDDNKTIKLYGVPDKTNVKVTFEVEVGGYLISTDLSFEFNILCNFLLVANIDKSETPDEDIKMETAMETNLILTPDSDGKFDIDVPIANVLTVDNGKDSYYDVLSCNLYNFNNRKLNEDNGLTFKLKDRYDGVAFDGQKLTFSKDFSGSVIIEIRVVTSLGSYLKEWTINVTPILELSGPRYETNRISSNSGAYSPNTTVDLVAASDAGVTFEKLDLFGANNSFQKVTATTSGTYPENAYIIDSNDMLVKPSTADYLADAVYYLAPEVHYSYKIFKEDSTWENNLSNKEIYDMTEGVISNSYGNSGYLTTSYNFKVKLPYVPASMNDETYFVVYKAYITYLDLTESDVEKFYFTYRVQNNQAVKYYNLSSGSSANVNVDTRLDGKFLDLFYYKETFVLDSKNYALTYSNGAFSISDGANPYLYDGEDSGYMQFKYTDATSTEHVLYYKDSMLYNADKMSNAAASKDNNNKYYEDETSGYYSVFISNFSNILEYKTFIDSVVVTYKVKEVSEGANVSELYTYDSSNGYVPASGNAVSGTTYYEKLNQGVKLNLSIGEKMFDLVEKGGNTGRYGIEFNGYSSSNTLFTNELLSDILIVNNNITIAGIEACSKDNSNGFKLFSDNTINCTTKELKSLFPKFTNSETEVIGIVLKDTASPLPTVLSGLTITYTGNSTEETVTIAGITYNIYKLTAKKDVSSTAIYNISKDFYYINADAVYVPRYNDNDRFIVAYDESALASDIIGISTSAIDKYTGAFDKDSHTFTYETITGTGTAKDDLEINSVKLGIKKSVLEENYKPTNSIGFLIEGISIIVVQDDPTTTTEDESKTMDINIYFTFIV